MGRREEKKELTRKQILSAAADLFAKNGYENTSVDELAEEANISKGTFYYHFPSKEAVVVALRTDSFADIYENAMRAIADGSKPSEVLENVLLERAYWTEKNPVLARVFFEQRIQQFLFRDNDAVVYKSAKQAQTMPDKKQMGRFFYLVCELVRAGQKAKEFRRDLDAIELTQIIIATFIHAQGSWLGGYSSTSLVDKVHSWYYAILTGLSY